MELFLGSQIRESGKWKVQCSLQEGKRKHAEMETADLKNENEKMPATTSHTQTNIVYKEPSGIRFWFSRFNGIAPNIKVLSTGCIQSQSRLRLPYRS